MPREYVYGPAAYPDEQGVTGENENYRIAVSLGWSRQDAGGYVQLGTIRNGKEHSFDPADGLYADLDREGINDLIRLMRRARDQAFGRDE
jgi:hypothetical protein